MPGGDRTGPQGAGARTGRGMGYCNGYDRPGFSNPQAVGRSGFGFKRGWAGRGWHRGFIATGAPGWSQPATGQEIEDLIAQANELKTQLEAILKRIGELNDK